MKPVPAAAPPFVGGPGDLQYHRNAPDMGGAMKLLGGIIGLMSGCIFASAAAASNLLVNPDFSAGVKLDGWGRSNPGVVICPRGKYCGSMQFSPTDCCGDASSGSAVSTSLSSFDILSQCVNNIAPNTNYDMSVWIRRVPPEAEDRSPKAGFSITWYSSANCNGMALSNVLQSVQAGEWAKYEMLDMTAPAKASSAKFSLLTNSETPTDSAVKPVQTEFDNAFFGPSATVPVELQSFDVD